MIDFSADNFFQLGGVDSAPLVTTLGGVDSAPFQPNAPPGPPHAPQVSQVAATAQQRGMDSPTFTEFV